MPPAVYVETTILGYLTARPTRDLVAAARQQVTCEWWAGRRGRYALYVSELVLAEAALGAAHAAVRRLAAAEGLPLLPSPPRSAFGRGCPSGRQPTWCTSRWRRCTG